MESDSFPVVENRDVTGRIDHFYFFNDISVGDGIIVVFRTKGYVGGFGDGSILGLFGFISF